MGKIKTIIVLFEILFFVCTVYLGVRWYLNPTGNFEPLIVIVTALFFITEGSRRYLERNEVKASLNSLNDLKNESKKGNDKFKVTELYPEILIDYKGVSIKKFKQDFGEPNTEYEHTEGIIGLSYYSPKKYRVYNYSFKNGDLSFYVKNNDTEASVVDVLIKNEVEILVPPIHDTGSNYPKIILGKSTFKEIFSIEAPTKVYANNGSAAGATYVATEFYFGRFGNYSNFTFGLEGFVANEDIENHYQVLNEYKPNYVAIH